MYYKYKSWNPNTKRILESASLFYSEGSAFNDVFECFIKPEENSKIGGHSNITLTARSNFRILCLSKSRNHQLMWAHYAESYKGVCFQFDFTTEDRHFGRPLPINYSEHPPEITDLEISQKSDISKKVFFYKHTLWSYENEYRIQIPNSEKEVPFDPKSLKSIFIGPSIYSKAIFDEVVAAVVAFNSKHKTKVSIIRLKRKAHSYEIDEEEFVP